MPRSSEALANLGEVLSIIMDVSPLLVESKDVELLFRASVEVENTNIYQGDVPKSLSETVWWKKKNSSTKASQNSESKATNSSKPTATTQS